MTKEIPVFIFMGFLESGKTTFAKETLFERGFTEGEDTLLLVCEEGVEEYEEEDLKLNNIDMVVLEEEDINTEKLLELQDKYKPKQVIIEYNGMWKLEKLFQTRVPKGWTVVQVISLVDATTFDVYINNMKAIMMEQLSSADMIIFNRCDENTKKAEIRRSIKAVNRRANIIFEGMDGQAEMDEGELEIPYDIDADIIDIKDEDYGIFYIDAADNPEKYVGKTVRFRAMLYKPKEYKGKAFVPGRFAMTCCADDIAFIGFKCELNSSTNFKDRDWAIITAKVKSEYYKEFEGDGPVFYDAKLEKAEPAKEELVYFN